MFQQQRYDKILEILKSKKTISNEKLCSQIFCSPATLRRDLIQLEKMGLIRRYRGGVSIVMGANTEYSYTFRDMENRQAKENIAMLTLNFLQSGMSLFLDSSSTVLNVCPFLKEYNNITVVTNGISTAFYLLENACADTYIAGGYIKPGSSSIVGELSGRFIENFQADLALLSCRGADENGIYEADHQQALIKQKMMKNAKSTLLLCDSSKFGHSYFFRLGAYQDFEAVITEKALPEKIENAIITTGCEVLY